MAHQDIFDVDLFHSYAGNSSESIISMGELFLRQSEDYLDLLSVSVDNNDEDMWVNVAHKMKGMASFVGATRLCAICKQAEMDVQAFGGDGEGLLSLIQQETHSAQEAVQAYVNQVKEA